MLLNRYNWPIFACIVAMGLWGVPHAAFDAESSAYAWEHGGGKGLRTVEISIGAGVVRASIADTDAPRYEGLLGWSSLSDDKAVLLDFIREGHYAIHMQGMRFPIDAVWIDGQGVIKLLYENIRPDSGVTYPSFFPCRYCLELNAGTCKRYRVKIGQTVKFGKVHAADK